MHWTLRWLLIALLNRLCPPEHPPEEQLIAYGRELGRMEVVVPQKREEARPDTGPIVELPQTLQWPTLAWTRYYLDSHPHLRRHTTPLHKIELVPDDSWLNSPAPTVKVPAVKMQERHARFLRER